MFMTGITIEQILKSFEDASKVERVICEISLSFNKDGEKVTTEKNLFSLAKKEIDKKLKKGYILNQAFMRLREIGNCYMGLKRNEDGSYGFNKKLEHSDPTKCRVSCFEKSECKALYSELRLGESE